MSAAHRCLSRNDSFRGRTSNVHGAAIIFADFAGAADVPQVHVNYADLNLGTAAGATVLYQRIRGAADLVCGVPDNRDLGQLARARACAARAVTEAVTAVNAPAVTRVYEVKTGVAPVTRIAAIG